MSKIFKILSIAIMLCANFAQIGFCTLEFVNDDNENIAIVETVENDSTTIDRLLWWNPMQSLDEEYHKFGREVIDWNDLTYKSHLTVGQIELLLPDDYKYLASSFKQAEDDYSINAVFLTALSRLESANMTYRLMDRNNIFSFNANDGSIDDAICFDSLEECIDIVSAYLKNEYLTEGGMYYNGISIEAVNDRYASDQEWASKLREFF